MDPVTQPSQDDAGTGIDEALKQIKQWHAEGKTEDAKAGCKEVLEADPENAEAKTLLAELEKGATPAEEAPKPEAPAPTEPAEAPKPEAPAPATPIEEAPKPETPAPAETPKPKAPKPKPTEPEPTPEPKPTPEPTPTLESKPEAPATPEPKPETPAPDEAPKPEASKPETPEPGSADTPLYKIDSPTDSKPTEDKSTPGKPEKKGSHGIVLNIVLFLVVAGLIGGGVYAYLYFFTGEEAQVTTPVREEVVEEEIEEEEVEEEEVEEEITEEEAEEDATEEETTEEEASNNDQRFLDLTEIENLLLAYYEENHMYPEATQLETELGELPVDPVNEGEFIYAYAVYDNYLGENQEYILSGLFEDENEDHTLWTTGANPELHPDYRDTTLENVTYITGEEVADEEEPAEEEEEEIAEEEVAEEEPAEEDEEEETHEAADEEEEEDKVKVKR